MKAALLMLMLAGCVASTPQQSFCGAARPITLAKADKLTPETLRAIVGHNEIGERLCGWKAPGA